MFGGMDSWMGLALVVGAISAMDILTKYRYILLPLDQVFVCLAF